MKYLLPILLLSACSMPPAQSQRSSQKMDNEQSSEQAQTSAQHGTQGTNSIPIIIICNQLNSASSKCAAPERPLPETVKELVR